MSPIVVECMELLFEFSTALSFERTRKFRSEHSVPSESEYADKDPLDLS